MDILKQITQLSKNAQQEVIPEIDVRKKVLAQINQPVPSFDDMLFTYIVRSWIALSGAATVTAIIISIFAMQTWLNWSQPLASLLRDAATIIR